MDGLDLKTDGSIRLDPDYPNAYDYNEYSYFKPREAYAEKNRIDKNTRINIATAKQYSEMGLDKVELKQDFYNSYVWTSDGGFFVESSDYALSISNQYEKSCRY